MFSQSMLNTNLTIGHNFASSVFGLNRADYIKRNKINFTGQPDCFVRKEVSALNKAKTECIKTMKANVPYKKIFVVDEKNNKIVGRSLGTSLASSINDLTSKNKDRDLTLVYYHEKIKYGDRQNIFSFNVDDLKYLNATNIKKTVLTDEFGNEIRVSKDKHFQKLSKEQLETIQKEIFAALFDTLSDETKQRIVKQKKTKKNIEQILAAIKIQELSKSGMQAIDKFWEDNACKYGLVYESDITF